LGRSFAGGGLGGGEWRDGQGCGKCEKCTFHSEVSRLML
jgi:hypothetical protein